MNQSYTRPDRLSPEEERRLVEAARKNDRSAFDRLIETFKKPLIGFIYARIWSEKKDAEEIAQTIWIDVWEDIHKPVEEGGYDPVKGRFYTFIINRFAKYKICQWCDEKKRHENRAPPFISMEDENKQMPDLPDPNEHMRPDQVVQIEEELKRKVAIYSELFRLTFLCGGYPHQQLVFGLSKLIFGKNSPRGIEGDPLRIDSEHGALRLDELTGSFWKEYYTESNLAEDKLEKLLNHLEPLKMRLPLEVRELFQLNASLLKQLNQLHEQLVSSTTIRNYYTERGFTAAIPDWCYKVERRVRAILGLALNDIPKEGIDVPVEPQGCNRCKLRHVPPCETHL